MGCSSALESSIAYSLVLQKEDYIKKLSLPSESPHVFAKTLLALFDRVSC